ncbi:MAG: efflux RND transporter periplasmic adaptor subunit [Cytophagales bacterium]|nr:efflux RND transporter periplasmic adaptor subunit [Cytophagales bacterium]
MLLACVALSSCKNGSKDKPHDMQNMDAENKSNTKELAKNVDGMEGMDMSEENNMSDMEVPKKTENQHARFNDSLHINSMVIPVNHQVISSQRPVKPVLNIANNEIIVKGYIALDERRNDKVPARISGRIEKLYVKYNLQYVNKGAKIMDLYSPELNTYQDELLFLMKSGSDSILVSKAEEKLSLLGVSHSQIEEVKKTGRTFLTMSVYSPKSGYVFFKPSNSEGMNSGNSFTQDNSSSKMSAMGNNSNPSKNTVSETAQVREGNYVNKGEVLFWINDLETVWAMVAIDNSHQQKLKLGLKVSLVSEFYKKDTLHETIDFIEPVYKKNQKFIMSRIYLKNTDKKYKINSLVEVTINTPPTSLMLVPYSSVLFLGKRKIVWVLKEKIGENRIYEAREITIGIIHSEMVEVTTGLKAKEEIALNAGYLLDRESLIKPE